MPQSLRAHSVSSGATHQSLPAVIALSSSASKADRAIGDRLREMAQPATDDPTDSATVVRKAIESPLPAIDRMLTNSGAGGLMTGLIDQSGVKTTPGSVLVWCLLSGGLLPRRAQVGACVAGVGVGRQREIGVQPPDLHRHPWDTRRVSHED